MQQFYNTIGASGTQLKLMNAKAGTQNELVYSVFVKINEPLTPAQVYDILVGWGKIKRDETPITSIRRAITSLTKSNNKLEKLPVKIKGRYGVDNHKWRLKQEISDIVK